jgi:GT2 family glycosyltransferase
MVSIVIINFHSSRLINDCLQSIFSDPSSSTFQLLIPDNSPSDGAKEQITNACPSVEWIEMPGNEGFARANNAGIRQAKGDAILLLNPDTIVQGNAISECYQRLMASQYVAAGVQLLNPDGSPQVSGNYVPVGGINLMMQVPYIGNLLKWVAKKSGAASTNLPEARQKVTEVDWINGAFIMVKRSAIEKVGMLDEDFFLYHEESEWCSRLKKVGKLCIYGDLKVVHLEGQSANKAFASATSGYSNLSDKKGYQLMLSMFVRIRKEFGAGWYLFHLLSYTIAIPFILIIAFFHSLVSFSFSILKNVWGFSWNVFKCWQFVFVLFANKPHFYKVL